MRNNISNSYLWATQSDQNQNKKKHSCIWSWVGIETVAGGIEYNHVIANWVIPQFSACNKQKWCSKCHAYLICSIELELGNKPKFK